MSKECRWICSRLTAVALVGLCLMLSSSAAADGARGVGGQDEVVLKNGGMVRGTVVTLTPDREVTILVFGTGEARVIPWTEVKRVDRGKHAAASAPAQSAPLAAGPSPKEQPSEEPDPEEPRPKKKKKRKKPKPSPQATGWEESSSLSPGSVRLHIITDEPKLQLRRHVGTVSASVGMGNVVLKTDEIICRAPCGDVVDGSLGQEYFFGGPGITSSGMFQLFDQSGDLYARVKPGSKGMYLGGLIVSSVGAASLLSGSLFLLSAGNSANDTEREASDGTRTTGTAFLVVGVLGLVGGIPLWLMGRTTYEFVGAERGSVSLDIGSKGIGLRF